MNTDYINCIMPTIINHLSTKPISLETKRKGLLVYLFLLLKSVHPFIIPPGQGTNGRSTNSIGHIVVGVTAPRQVQQTSSQNIDTDVAPNAAAAESSGKEEKNEKIRPLDQNWWPVTILDSLDSTRPNGVELLGMKLVLFKSNDDDDDVDSWTCLKDRCAHRFAPLSEGRVVKNTNACSHIQCAYHGWEFDGSGSCKKIPQLDDGKTIGNNFNVESFPVRVDCGMVFVWADPETAQLGQLIPLPTFPLLKETVETNGLSTCFMRDLPYGYELLGENLLDLSHLPFSHHSVMSLQRDLGGPLPFKMLSKDEKSSDKPLFEAILENAANTDPTFKSIPSTPNNATLNLGFYEPCHVRYTRVGSSDKLCIIVFLSYFTK
mmetsp:Transcript_4948/g.6394  ORF Transcript_4948/g.6394 Transcript_4948/m.6394 type:complete len:376 (+) Transcript_4948:69-1196(+)